MPPVERVKLLWCRFWLVLPATEGTVASPAPGRRAHSGAASDDAAFMIYISPDSKFSSLATTVSPFVQMPLLANNRAS
jgi:hypothetical protein